MIVDQPLQDDVADVVGVRGRVSRFDVRELGRELRLRLEGGSRHVVLDLTAATDVPEGQLILVLLALRREARRRGGRIVVAAPPGLFERLSRSLALDDLIDVAATLAEAVEPLASVERSADPPPAPGATAEPEPMLCRQCGTTWYSRVAALVLEAGMACARCGAPLTAP